MSTTPLAFIPAQGYRDSSFAPTDPPSEAAFRDVMQDIPDQLRDYINTTLIPIIDSLPTSLDVLTLTNTTPYTPTAQYHPATKAYIDAVAAAFVLGALSPNSVLNSMLGTDVKVGSLALLSTTVKTDVVSAINETVTRELNLARLQSQGGMY